MRAPKAPPPFGKLLKDIAKAKPEILLKVSEPGVRDLVDQANDEGWNWEDCRYRVPAGLSGDEFWLLVKISRVSDRESVPLLDKTGKPFTYWLPSSAQRVLHLIDTNLGGTIESSFPQIDSSPDRTRYL